MTENEFDLNRDIINNLYKEFNCLFEKSVSIVDNAADGLEQKTRKQVIEEIKSKVKELIDSKDFGLCNHEYANGFCFGLQYDLAKILDQVERSEK